MTPRPRRVLLCAAAFFTSAGANSAPDDVGPGARIIAKLHSAQAWQETIATAYEITADARPPRFKVRDVFCQDLRPLRVTCAYNLEGTKVVNEFELVGKDWQFAEPTKK